MLLEVSGHLVERARQCAELILRADGYTRAEISSGQLAHALRKAGEVLRHPMRDGNDPDKCEPDNEQSEPQVSHRCATDVEERVTDGSRNAEDDATRCLAGDDEPVAAAARRAFGSNRCGALDSQRIETVLVGLFLCLERTLSLC